MVKYLINFETTKISGDHLSYAVSRDNLQVVETLLKNGAKVEGVVDYGNYCSVRHILYRVGISRRKETLQLLLHYGLNITSIRNELGENILNQFIHYCTNTDDTDLVEIAEILVNLGVPPDESDEDGYTPLHRAVQKRNESLASYLISKGADVNKKDTSKTVFPLLMAVTQCNKDFVELLLSNGARINEKDNFGWTALHVACLQPHEPVISLLMLEGADIAAVENSGRTAFSFLEPDHCQKHHRHCRKSIITMIKEFSKLSFENLLTSKSNSDIDLIQKNSETRECFKQCTLELHQMASTKFYGPYSYYSVLKMSKNITRSAHLTKNGEFVSKFGKNLSKFNYYQSDLKRISNEAFCERQRLEIIEKRLNSTLGNTFPAVVIRNLQKYLTIQDLPLQ